MHGCEVASGCDPASAGPPFDTELDPQAKAPTTVAATNAIVNRVRMADGRRYRAEALDCRTDLLMAP